jgi:glycosyltransferase involved in cell wall biosynthesis
MLLSIITISCNSINDLFLTSSSINIQSIQPFEHVIVGSGYSQSDLRKIRNTLASPIRKFIFNKDNGIYDAMNIGLREASGTHVLFLNSGDLFLSSHSVSVAYQAFLSLDDSECNKCIAFSSIQSSKSFFYIRPPARIKKQKLYGFPHQSFISPINKTPGKRIYFNLSHETSADQYWMQQLLAIYGIKLSLDPLSVFTLGGVSTSYRYKLFLIFYKEKKYAAAIKAYLKFIIRLLIGEERIWQFLAIINGYGRIPRNDFIICQHNQPITRGS